MAITAAFTITQGDDPSKATITDTTNYSGGELVANMTSRTVTVVKSDGTTLATKTFTGNELTVELTDLATDYAIKATLVLVSNAADVASVYEAEVYKSLNGYAMAGFYDRHKRMSVQQRLESNRAYTNDTFNLLMEVDAAVNAETLEDIVGAQLCLDRANKIINSNKTPY